MERILCPLDVHEPTERRVLDYAVGTAAELGAEVCVLHVVQFSSDLHHPASVDLQLEEAEKTLKAVLANTRGLETTVTGDLRPGVPHREIAEEIENGDIDLVVMGTHSRGGIRRFFLGSVAERVVRTSPVPVLTVPYTKEQAGVAPTSLLVTYDFSESSRRALESADGLGTKLGAEIHVVHVMAGDPDDDGSEEYTPSAERTRLVESVERELVRDVAEVFGSRAESVTHRTIVGVPIDEIGAAQRDLGADLIVVGTSGKGGIERVLLGSVATGVLRASDVPVLTVP